MKHFHTIDSENDENTNTGSDDDGDEEPPLQSFAMAPANKATVPRIRIRLGKKKSSQLEQQQPSFGSNNAFGLKVESLDSFSFEDDEDDEDDESIQLLADDDSSSSSESAAEARDPASTVVSSPSSPSSATTQRRQRKRVSFGMVQVQEYNLTLGDHPFSDSYPISLDWPHTEAREYNLDIFERVRRLQSSSVPKSSSSTSKVLCRHLTPAQRRSRLANISGIHPSDLAKQEQRRHQQLVVELEQSYYANDDEQEGMEVDGREAHEYNDQWLVQEPPTPSHASCAANAAAVSSLSDRTSVMSFWEECEEDAYEPLELSRTKSLAEFDPMDCSILQYLCEGGDDSNYRNGTDAADAELFEDNGEEEAFRGRRRQQHRHSDFERSSALHHEDRRRRKSTPW